MSRLAQGITHLTTYPLNPSLCLLDPYLPEEGALTLNTPIGHTAVSKWNGFPARIRKGHIWTDNWGMDGSTLGGDGFLFPWAQLVKIWVVLQQAGNSSMYRKRPCGLKPPIKSQFIKEQSSLFTVSALNSLSLLGLTLEAQIQYHHWCWNVELCCSRHKLSQGPGSKVNES